MPKTIRFRFRFFQVIRINLATDLGQGVVVALVVLVAAAVV